MTDNPPEALRLADWLDAYDHEQHAITKAAAELRRLHAENENLRTTLRVEEACSFRTQMQQYAAQRDELLEALHEISLCSQNSTSGKEECGRIARAAIAKAEGTNND